jgi:hypothetical protein
MIPEEQRSPVDPANGATAIVAGAMTRVLERKLEVFFGSGVTNTTPRPSVLTVGELAQRFSLPDTNRGRLTSAEYHALDKSDLTQKKLRAREKDGEYFCVSRFRPGATRHNDNVSAVWGIALDFDSGRTTEQMIRERLFGLTYIAYTSYSHRPGDERWRAIVIFSGDTTAEKLEVVFDHFNALFDGDLDPRGKVASQAWFTPACPNDAAHEFHQFYEVGEFFDPASLPDSPARVSTPISRIGTGQALTGAARAKLRVNVAAALATQDADEYKTWIDYGLALKNDLGEDGKDLWLEWSGKSSKFDPDEAEETWESLKPRGPDQPRITCASILYNSAQAVKAQKKTHVETMNKEFFIASIGSRVAIFQEELDPITNRVQLSPRNVTDFALLMKNRMVITFLPNGKSKEVNLGELWLMHPDRREYRRVVLAPEGCGPEYYNLWRGFAVEPKPGSWEKLRWHLLNVICDGNQQHFDYLLGWLAFCVQRPGERPEVAVVLRGGRGSGKGFFLRAIGSLFGSHFLQVSQPGHMTGHFNGHLQNVLFLFADESFYAGDKRSEGALKTMITEPTITIERKGFDAESWPNRLKIVIASNNDWIVPAGADERRFFVLDVSDQKKQNHEYFAALQAEIDNGGLAAMLHELLHMDLSYTNVREAPWTQGLVQQKILSMSPIERWWFDKLQTGQFRSSAIPGFEGFYWGLVPTEVVHEDYLRGSRQTGSNYRSTATQLGMALPKLLPGQNLPVVKRDHRYAAERCNHYEFPNLADCRRHFEEIFGLDSYPWPEEDVLRTAARIKDKIEGVVIPRQTGAVGGYVAGAVV